MDELKPCQCGSVRLVILTTEDDRDSPFVYCRDCGRSGPSFIYVGNGTLRTHITEDEARALWNLRPIEDALRSEVERLRAELEAMHRLYDHFKTENEHDAWDVLDVWFQSNAPMK